MKRQYDNWKPSDAVVRMVILANQVLSEFAEQGFDLTLRQVYYQFIARDYFPDDRWWRWIEGTRRWVHAGAGEPGATKNAEPNYKWLGEILNRGRMAGLIDWDLIVDRTRKLDGLPHFRDPAHLIESALTWFHTDRWEDQPCYVEVWVEKDALVGVIERAANLHDVPFFSCRGYTSQSEMWVAGQRLLRALGKGKKVRILHLGDHDPSGIDMSRDIEERLFKFLAVDHWRLGMEGSGEGTMPSVDWVGERFGLDRLALNWDQIEEYGPPPNPAKLTDSRGAKYVEEHGYESWELDALEPTVLAGLIREAVEGYRDEELWEAACAEEERHRRLLGEASKRWEDIEELLS